MGDPSLEEVSSEAETVDREMAAGLADPDAGTVESVESKLCSSDAETKETPFKVKFMVLPETPAGVTRFIAQKAIIKQRNEIVKFGRQVTNDVRVNDKKASREHMVMNVVENEQNQLSVVVKVVGEKKNVLIDNQPVTTGQTAVLTDGCKIVLEDLHLQVKIFQADPGVSTYEVTFQVETMHEHPSVSGLTGHIPAPKHHQRSHGNHQHGSYFCHQGLQPPMVVVGLHQQGVPMFGNCPPPPYMEQPLPAFQQGPMQAAPVGLMTSQLTGGLGHAQFPSAPPHYNVGGGPMPFAPSYLDNQRLPYQGSLMSMHNPVNYGTPTNHMGSYPPGTYPNLYTSDVPTREAVQETGPVAYEKDARVPVQESRP